MNKTSKFIVKAWHFFAAQIRRFVRLITALFLPLAIVVFTGSAGALMWVFYLLAINHDSCSTQDLISYAGALATFSAVVVALFKNQILNYIQGPRFEIIEPSEGVTLKEFPRGQNTRETVSLYYDIGIKNAGGGIATDCSIEPCEIRFRKDRTSDFYKKTQSTVFTEITWKNGNKDLSSGIVRQVRLFEIKPPTRSEYPNGDGIQDAPKLCLWGCRINGSDKRAGEWEITYSITSRNGTHRKFLINIIWDGTFCNDIKNLDECITANIRTL